MSSREQREERQHLGFHRVSRTWHAGGRSQDDTHIKQWLVWQSKLSSKGFHGGRWGYGQKYKKHTIGIRGGWHLVSNLDPSWPTLWTWAQFTRPTLWTWAGYSAFWALVSSSINWYNHISFTGRAYSQEIQDSRDFVSVGSHLGNLFSFTTSELQEASDIWESLLWPKWLRRWHFQATWSGSYGWTEAQSSASWGPLRSTGEMYDKSLPVMVTIIHKSWYGKHEPKEKTPSWTSAPNPIVVGGGGVWGK